MIAFLECLDVPSNAQEDSLTSNLPSPLISHLELAKMYEIQNCSWSNQNSGKMLKRSLEMKVPYKKYANTILQSLRII